MTKCKNCGKEYGMDTRYDMGGIRKCRECAGIKGETRPIFIQHIPNFVDGGTAKVFYFNGKEDFFEQLKNLFPLENGWEYAYNDDHIMRQSFEEKSWWVIGRVRNFPIESLGLSRFDYEKIKRES